METLFVLRKKFGNSRIVRTISEYRSGNRTIWLKKYRFVLRNGHNSNIMICHRCGNRMYYCNVFFCSKYQCQNEYLEEEEEESDFVEVNKVVILQKGIFRPQLNSTYFQIYYRYTWTTSSPQSLPDRTEIRRISDNYKRRFFTNSHP